MNKRPTREQIKTAQEEAIAQTKAAHEALVQRYSDSFELLAPQVTAQFDTLGLLINTFMTHQGFWQSDNTGEKIALMHSELSEALEADRKNLESEHIPEFSGVEEELADVLIRIFDFAHQHELRLGAALAAKMQFNLTRPFKHGKNY